MKKSLLSCFFCVIWAVNVWATPRYEAEVSVDVTAETVVVAKKQAMAKAIRDGLNEVVLSVSTEKGWEFFEQLSDNQLQYFISGVMVLMEKTSDVRYIADLRISVNEDILTAYMQENDVPVIVSSEQDVMVIPLLERVDGTIDLWGDDNVWRQAFIEQRNLKKGTLNIHNIEKNLGNITMVEAEHMFDMSDDEYNELASFNRMGDIYVIKYSLKDDKVYVKNFPSREVNEVVIEGEKPEVMVNKVLRFFRDTRKAIQAEEPDIVAQEKIEVVYSYQRLADWMRLRKMLEDNPQVQDINIVSMVNGKVYFNFLFGGVIEKLQGTLEVNGYKLRNDGGHYVIY